METKKIFNKDISFIEIIKLVFLYKKTSVSIISLSVIISALYSFSLNDKYASESVLQYVYKNYDISDDSLGGGTGIASILGLNSSSSQVNTNLLSQNILKSKDFFEVLYTQDNFLINLMAVDSYDTETNTISIDKNIYNHIEKKWVRDYRFKNVSPKPSLEEAYKNFYSKNISISSDNESDLITLKIVHESPYLAAEWSLMIVKLLNNTIKVMKVDEAKKSLEFIESKLQTDTNIAYMQKSLSKLMEQKIQIITLSEISEDFVYKIIDSPRIAEKKDSPQRLIIIIFGFVFGCVVNILFLFSRKFLLR